MRQLRGEARKGLTPMTAAMIVAAAVLAALLQFNSAGNGPAPSLVDTTGAFQIALLQHATLLGFVVTGIIAGQMTGAEMSDSSIMVTMTAEPRRLRLFVIKTVATSLIAALSVAVMGALLAATGQLMGLTGVSFADDQGTAISNVAETATRLLLVLAFLSAVTTTLAAWSGSTITPAMVTAGTFIMGLMLSGVDNVAADPTIRLAEFTPYMWVTRWMQPDFGRFVDFIGNATTPIHIQRSALILLACIMAGTIVGRRLIDNAVRNPKGNS